MPITIKTGNLKYKKSDGTYNGFNAIAQESTDQQLADIHAAGTAEVGAVTAKGEEVLESIPEDYTELSGDVDELKSALESVAEFHYGKNRFDITEVTIGAYLNPANGQPVGNSSHGYTNLIPVETNIVISSDRSILNTGLRVCFYDIFGAFVNGSGKGPADMTETYNSNLLRYYVSLAVPNGAAYVKFSCTAFTQTQYTWNIQLEIGNTPTAYMSYTARYMISETAIPEEQQLQAQIASTEMPSVSSSTFNDDDVIELPQITFHGRKSYSFFGLVTTMGTLRVGHESVYGGSYLLIDATQIKVMVNYGSDSVYHTFDHGLTISDYIGVSIKVGTNGRASIELSTNGGTYTHDNVVFPGRNGKIQAISDGCVFTDVRLSYASDCFRDKIWICGDSYLSNDNDARWPYQAKSWGYDGFALIGYPGEASERGYTDFTVALAYGTPKYAVWAYGMNDHDSSVGINSSWLSNIVNFLVKCAEKEITPILCTIPNTPIISNLYKNAYVKASGFRYIDFAKAVNAESGNATWFNGMLSTDNVHPTVQGAKALASQAIADMPELMLSF